MLLDKKQAAKHLTICVDTLMSECHNGRLIGFKIGGRWRFDTRDLDQYIESRRQEASITARAKTQTKGKNIISIKKVANGSEPPLDRFWMPGKKIEQVCAAQLAKQGKGHA